MVDYSSEVNITAILAVLLVVTLISLAIGAIAYILVH
jgi:preprotein translocase subunit SecE